MIIRIVYSFAFLLLIIAAILAQIFLGDIQYPLIIHFDKYQGINLWGESIDVFKIIIFGAIIHLINMGIGQALKRKSLFGNPEEKNREVSRTGPDASIASGKAVQYILGFTSVFISILILVAVGVIISVN